MLTAYPILHHVMFAHDDVSQLCFWMVRLFQIFNQIALLGETFKSMYHLMRTLRPAEHTGMTFFCGQFCISFALCVSFNFWSFSIFLWKLLKLYVCVCVWIWECMWMSVCGSTLNKCYIVSGFLNFFFFFCCWIFCFIIIQLILIISC